MKQTAGEIINTWLGDGNTGTIADLCIRFGLTHRTVTAALYRLRVDHMAAPLEAGKPGRKGQRQKVWATTFITNQGMPAKASRTAQAPSIDVECTLDDYRPLSRHSAASIVEKAMANRHPLDIAWQSINSPTT